MSTPAVCLYCGGVLGESCFAPHGSHMGALVPGLEDFETMREQEAAEEHGNYEYQEPALGLVKQTRPRFEVTWDGYAESCFKVADNHTRAIIKEFDCAILGTNTARTAAGKLATTLNGELRQCPDCGGTGREQMGPSERPCIHCNGGGFQVFKR